MVDLGLLVSGSNEAPDGGPTSEVLSGGILDGAVCGGTHLGSESIH